MKIYSIKDEKTQTYTTIFEAENEQIAKRQCGILANDPNSIISHYAEDFLLYQIGEINKKTGEIKSNIEYIINLKELKKEEK